MGKRVIKGLEGWLEMTGQFRHFDVVGRKDD